MNFDPNQMSKEQLQTLANGIYPGIAMYARDVNLPPELARKYVPGQIIREKAITDASSRFHGDGDHPPLCDSVQPHGGSVSL